MLAGNIKKLTMGISGRAEIPGCMISPQSCEYDVKQQLLMAPIPMN
jgi:hypothetical protein